MKAILVGLFSCAVFAVPVLAQTPETAATGDQAFVNMAAQTDMTEAHLGQMATEQGGTQGVKDFGQTLVTDHTKDYKDISAAATKAGMTVPKGLDAKQDNMIAPFDKLKGRMFDRRFVHEMVVGHEHAIAAYTKESQDGQNADIKAYAAAALPTLQQHEAAAKALETAK